jgi:hypothetical protein
MDRTVLDIHPLDMAELFDSANGDVDVIVMAGIGNDGTEIPDGTVEFRGQLYRQTTSVPVKTTRIV